MAEISGAVGEVARDRTGAGMMDCKRPSRRSGGDEEQAIDLLRQRGAAKAAKRAERETSEGAVAIEEDDDGPVRDGRPSTCETDFVARNDEFQEFAGRAALIAADAGRTKARCWKERSCWTPEGSRRCAPSYRACSPGSGRTSMSAASSAGCRVPGP